MSDLQKLVRRVLDLSGKKGEKYLDELEKRKKHIQDLNELDYSYPDRRTGSQIRVELESAAASLEAAIGALTDFRRAGEKFANRLLARGEAGRHSISSAAGSDLNQQPDLGSGPTGQPDFDQQSEDDVELTDEVTQLVWSIIFGAATVVAPVVAPVVAQVATASVGLAAILGVAGRGIQRFSDRRRKELLSPTKPPRSAVIGLILDVADRYEDLLRKMTDQDATPKINALRRRWKDHPEGYVTVRSQSIVSGVAASVVITQGFIWGISLTSAAVLSPFAPVIVPHAMFAAYLVERYRRRSRDNSGNFSPRSE